VPRVTLNLIAVHVHTCKDVPTPESITGKCEDVLEFIQEVGAQKVSSTVRSLATGYGLGNAYAGEILYRPLTTRVLHEHNL
jgi:diaminopimelate decarboxylase